MGYINEHSEEFKRLEEQTLLYDYRRELQGLAVKDGARILDAGCGSGVVSRYLANQFPTTQVIACDYTASLLVQARDAAKDIPNLTFEEQDLKNLIYPSGQFDLIISRFVLHLQDAESLSRIIAEMVRVLKPGGSLVVINNDGGIVNLYPQTQTVQEGLQKLAAVKEIDLHIGRKLPYLLSEAGLVSVTWRKQNLESWGENKEIKLEHMHAQFRNASAFYERVLGGKENCNAFHKEYIECLEHPQCVYFYHTFIVGAMKPE